jgi:hypothetical protein
MQVDDQRARLQLKVLSAGAMNLADDATTVIIIAACGLAGVAVPIFAILAVKQWRVERRTKRANAHLNRAKAQTWNPRSGEWVTEEDT